MIWSPALGVHECEQKLKKFHDILVNNLDKFLPITRTRVRQSDKPWMTPHLKAPYVIAKKRFTNMVNP